MRKLIVLNQKGGVGKTTVSTNIAYGLSLRDKKVLLLDLDPQAHATAIYRSDLAKNDTIIDWLTHRKYVSKNAIRPAMARGQVINGLDIVPSNIRLSITVESIASAIYRERLIDNHLRKLASCRYDFVIIDCPPAVNLLTVNAIYTADAILIPTTYGRYSLDGIADLFDSIASIKEGAGVVFDKHRILRNIYDARNSRSVRYVEDMLKQFDLFKTKIRKNEAVNQAQMNSEPVSLFDNRSNGAKDFAALTEEVLQWLK